jgi:hypothetical protein
MGVQQNNKTKLLLRFLLFSSYPSFLPTHLPISPFFLTCLPIYLPTYIFSYLPTVLYWPEWANSHQPAFSVCSSHAQVFLPTYLHQPFFLPVYLPIYLLTPPFFFFSYLRTILFWPEWTKSYWPAFCVCKFSCRSVFTYLLFYSGHSEPAVTNLLTVYVVSFSCPSSF